MGLSVILFVLFLGHVMSFQQSRTVCNYKSQDPSFLEILNFMSPSEVVDAIRSVGLEENFPESIQAMEGVKRFLSGRMPILSFMSVGKWRVEYEQPISTFSFNDIYLLQENYALVNVICNNFGGNPFLNQICRCWTGTPYSSDSTSNHDAQWCLIKPSCSDKSLSVGYCDVAADTIRSSCIFLNTKGSPPKSDFMNTHINYSRSVPTLSDWWSTIQSVFEAEFSVLSENDTLRSLDQHVHKVLSFIPSFPIVFLLGVFVVCNARDLAEAESIQNLMIAVYGLLLALIFLLYLLYRMSEKLISRYGGPVGPFVHIPVLLSMGSYMFTNPYIPNVIFHALIDFWRTGAPFGVWWLGKAYFVASIGGSFYLTWMFDLFKVDTSSWHCLHYSVKLIGLVLLAHCTSSNELAVVLTVLGLFPEHISHYCWTIYLMVVTFNQTPSYKHLSGGRMTEEQFAETSKIHTKKHLAALKLHLQQNPNVLNNVMDRFQEGGKDNEKRLIERFADGSYPGVPYTETVEKEEKKRGYGWLLSSLVVLSVFGAMAAIFYK